MQRPGALEENQIAELENELSEQDQTMLAELGQRPQSYVGDLTDGGKVGAATVFPTQDGKRIGMGRANSWPAWMWDGTPTRLPLAWQRRGKTHDSAMHYRRKKHCLCCNEGGFLTRTCPGCVKRNCTKCGGQDNPKVVIRCFYLREKDVPYPREFYGKIGCFLPTCPRQGELGFLSGEEMRIHARFMHSAQYRSHLENQESIKDDEIRRMRDHQADTDRRLNALLDRLDQRQETVAMNPPVRRGKRKGKQG